MNMTKVAILIPVLRRPQNVYPLAYSVQCATTVAHELLFIASPNDHEEISELKDRGMSYIVMDDNYENRGDYARKINAGYEAVDAEWYFLGADDLQFHPLWFEVAMEFHQKSDACVIGTNDMGNPQVTSGQHATHSLVLGEYVKECGTIDEPGKVLHEGYRHNFVDSEFVATAKWRDAWVFATTSRVEHLHPDWNKGKGDSVYALGKSGFAIDQKYFEQRKRLWR